MLIEVSMKLPTFKRILKEDLKEAPGWIDKVIGPVNSFFESIYHALNKGLTFEENIAAQIRELSFTTTAGYNGTVAQWKVINFQSTLGKRAKGLILLQLTQVEAVYTPIENDICIDWQDLNGDIRIGLIRGLTASKTYQLRVLLI
jgi:hypothetical protein